ncbi:MAG: response regulator transcription factor, partial [Blautia sp.]|nr:response regulator transcription factor [Blautia sp.]
MRIAIVDDSPADREQLEECLGRYFADAGEAYELDSYSDASSFLASFSHQYDFVILDIEMPGLGGMEAAKALRRESPCVTIMFLTNMPQYAIDAYAVEAMDYMLKPISYPDFVLKMQKAKRYIARNANAPLLFSTPEGARQCMTADLLYVESEKHYLQYHVKDGSSFRVRDKLTSAEKKLSPYHFVRSDESYLVNLSYVTAVEGNTVLLGELSLPISRRRRTAF